MNLRFFIGLIAVGGVHFILGIILYKGRIAGYSSLLQSDFIVFILPAIPAFIGYVAISWGGGRIYFF